MNSDRSKSQMSVVRVFTVFLHLNYLNVTSSSLDSGGPGEAQVFDGVDKLLGGVDKRVGDGFGDKLNIAPTWCVFELGSFTLSCSVTFLE